MKRYMLFSATKCLLYIAVACCFTPLCAQKRDSSRLDVVKAYILQGGNVNKLDEYGFNTYFHHQAWSFGYYGDTALFPMVTYMIEKQSPIKYPFWFLDDYSLETGHFVMRYVQLLMANGNRVSTKDLQLLVKLYFLEPYYDDGFLSLNDLDYFGKTPLMYACELEQKKLVRYLLKHGAKQNIRSSEGKTAADFCKTNAMRRCLKRSGGG